MRSKNRKRVLLVSGAIILLCMTIIAGMTFALFTDSKRVKNHLQAGDLEVTLTRTYLEYSVLNPQGKLAVTKVEEDLNFTNSTNQNVFGVDAKNIRIVPGSYFKADLRVDNIGNVAFTYDVGIQLVGVANALSEQLQVTITRADGTSVTKMLTELANGLTITGGELLVGTGSQTFTVEVRFIDDTAVNNAAQAELVEFDLVVSAVQSTT